NSFMYDSNGHPVLVRGMCAQNTRIYDEAGRILEDQNFGPDGKPMADPVTGVARTVYTYNTLGKMDRFDAYDVDGNRLETLPPPKEDTEIALQSIYTILPQP